MFQGMPWRVWVKKRRKELGLTQAQVAELASYSVEMIGHVERGLNKPSAELAALLADILGVDPERRAEFLRVARLEPADAADKAPRRRPALRIPGLPATPMIGRVDDLARVYQALTRPDQRLVTISGAPGVGKTRLAMHIARDLEAAYADGVFWVELVSVREPSLVFTAVAQALDAKESAEQSLADALQAALWGRQVLLVLDNCEQVQGIAAAIAELLAYPGVQILATSRRRLRVRGEQQIPLVPLRVPPVAAPAATYDPQAYPALALFLERAQETSPDFSLDSKNAATVAQICAALDGLPLAIELAAARVRVLPPAVMLDRLHECLDWLVGGPEDLPAHQQTLAGALAWSYDLLGPAQQLLFRRLSVFQGGFTLAGACAVCGDLEGVAADVLPAIIELDEGSLLQHLGGPETDPRYGMLATIHDFATRLLRESGEGNRLRHAHLSFYLNLAEQAQAARTSADMEAWLVKLETEQENFRAALDWGLSARGDLQMAMRLTLALGWYWETRGYWQEGRRWFTRLLAKGDQPAGRLSADLRYFAGRFAYLQGDYAIAEQFLEESRALGEQLEDLQIQLRALNTLGWVTFSRCEYNRAQRLQMQSLNLCRVMGDPPATAAALNSLAATTIELGDLVMAERLLEESLLLRREQGDRQGMARSLNGLGVVAQHRDDNAQAQQLIGEAIELFRTVGDKLGLALGLSNLGLVHLAEGHSIEARDCLAEALDLAREVGSAWCTSFALCNLGWVELHQGSTSGAERLLQESLTLAQANGMKAIVILTRLGQARLAANTGDFALAARRFRSAEELVRETGTILTPFRRGVAARLERELQGYLSPAASSSTRAPSGE